MVIPSLKPLTICTGKRGKHPTIYTHIHIHIHTHTDTHTYTYIREHKHMHAYIHMHTHTHTHTRTHAHTHTHTHTNTDTHMHIHIYIRTFLHKLYHIRCGYFNNNIHTQACTHGYTSICAYIPSPHHTRVPSHLTIPHTLNIYQLYYIIYSSKFK